MVSRQQLGELLRREVVDIHGVAEILGMSRSSVNVLLIRPASKFPKPIYETKGDNRRPIRLWLRQEVIAWRDSR
jgi:predicted DNA-binding transcriptional regulator AlpA